MSNKNTLRGMPEPPETATPGRSIPKGYNYENKQYTPQCVPPASESITMAGSSPWTALDEQTALSNMVLSIDCVYAEDFQSIDGQNGQERI